MLFLRYYAEEVLSKEKNKNSLIASQMQTEVNLSHRDR